MILVGENPASQVYVRNKIKACHEAGMVSFDFPFLADVAPKLVFDKIAELNNDPRARHSGTAAATATL